MFQGQRAPCALCASPSGCSLTFTSCGMYSAQSNVRCSSSGNTAPALCLPAYLANSHLCMCWVGQAGDGTATVLVHLSSELADSVRQLMLAGIHDSSQCLERASRSMLDMCVSHGQQQVCCGALP